MWKVSERSRQVDEMVDAARTIRLLVVLALSFPLQSSGGQQSSLPTRYFELRFQSEVDNSTILKEENQQQIFKCQIRLAPSSAGQQTEEAGQPKQQDARLKTVVRPLDGASGLHSTLAPNETDKQTSRAWPANVSLTVDWFKDGQPLVSEGQAESSVSIVNVELSKANSTREQKNDKRNRTRIEVKNTSNSNQLKLTSRLKIGRLMSSDSGHYKCLARARFQMPLAPATANAAGAAAQLVTTSTVHLIEQTLESSSSILSVVKASNATG